MAARPVKEIIMSEKVDNDSIDNCFKELEELVNSGKKDISINFSNTKSLKSDAVLRLCSVLLFLKSSNDIVSTLNFAGNNKIRQEMINNNWANLIDDTYPKSSFKGYLYTPAVLFQNETEHQETINRILEILLEAYPDFDRGSFSAIEWFLCEVMDNVLVHSQSKIGGIVQIKILRNASKDIEIVIADAGVGIPDSLREIYPKVDESIIVMNSINEGITNGKGQGNGLFGASEICRKTKGEFLVYSGNIRLRLNNNVKGAKIINRFFKGTTISAVIRTNDNQVLNEALMFKGKVHKPTDYIELVYEGADFEKIYLYKIDRKIDSIGSRPYGHRLRNKLLNIHRMSEDIDIIKIDFGDIDIISHSFADELISKIIEIKGIDYFINNIQVINCNKKIESILNSVIYQRNKISVSFAQRKIVASEVARTI